MRRAPAAGSVACPPHRLAWHVELVAGAVDRDEPARMLGRILERAAQLDEVIVDGARVRIVLVPPGLVEQHVARDDLAGPLREHLQDGERAARQLDSLALAGRDLPDEIDLELTEREADRFALLALRSAQHRGD